MYTRRAKAGFRSLKKFTPKSIVPEQVLRLYWVTERQEGTQRSKDAERGQFWSLLAYFILFGLYNLSCDLSKPEASGNEACGKRR